MKETVQEAAKEAIHKHYNCNGTYPCSEREYCEHCNGCNTAFDCNECGADEYKEGFIAGAEWEAKQSPWISVDERYPDYDNSIPLDKRERYIVRVESGSVNMKIHYTIAWLTGRYRFNVEMDWVKVTHWLPIPTFDEILEANKDVLKRIKEKGDRE